MKRREFILGGAAAAAWPLAARAQQPGGMRRIGVLTPLAADDPEHKARLAAFVEGLQQLGWEVGRNVEIETRASAGDTDRARGGAAELVELTPDVILATGGSVVGPLLKVTRRIPVVFTQTPDPVGAVFADSLSRPGGNATGFTLFEYGTSGKWLELLKEVAPGTTQMAVPAMLPVRREEEEDWSRGRVYISPAMRCYCAATGARTMTIKTLAAVVGTLAIIVVLFFITKITTPSRLVAKSGFFAGSSTDDWGRGTGATGFWEPIRVEGRQEQMPQ